MLKRLKTIGIVGAAIIGALVAVVIVMGWLLSVSLPEQALEALRKSPNYAHGVFRNVEPEADAELSWDMVKAQFFGKQQRVPPGPLPIVNIDPAVLSTPPAEGLRTIWLGHSSVLIEIDGFRVLTDAVLSERASPFQWAGPQRFHPPPLPLAALKGIDVAVHSHNHYDHLDKMTVLQLAKNGTQILVPLGMASELKDWGVPANRIHELDWWESFEMGALKVVATPARHYSGRGLFDYQATLWASWTVLGPKHRVFYSGDSGYSAVFADIGQRFGPFDLNIIKVGAYGPGDQWRDIHMQVDKAVQVHLDLGGKRMLPVHWATFNMGHHAWDEPIVRAVAEAARHNVELVTPRVGQVVEANSDFKSEAWWETVRPLP